jgi:hypothetical protein
LTAHMFRRVRSEEREAHQFIPRSSLFALHLSQYPKIILNTKIPVTSPPRFNFLHLPVVPLSMLCQKIKPLVHI